MILYAKIGIDGYIDSFSDTESDEFNIEFEIDDEEFYDLSACSGKCFKIEDGVAVKKKDVNEHILSYKDKTLKLKEIVCLKQQLFESDYKAIKYSEGFYTEEEYEPIKQERASIRLRINQLEGEINDSNNT